MRNNDSRLPPESARASMHTVSAHGDASHRAGSPSVSVCFEVWYPLG